MKDRVTRIEVRLNPREAAAFAVVARREGLSMSGLLALLAMKEILADQLAKGILLGKAQSPADGGKSTGTFADTTLTDRPNGV